MTCARATRPLSLCGAAQNSVCERCPGRDAGRGRVARGGFALAWGCTRIICIDSRPYSRPKVTPPLPSGRLQSARKDDLRTSGGRVRGRPAERSGGGCQKRVWPAVSAPRVPDTGMRRVWQETLAQLFNGLPEGSETERGASSPGRQGAEASPFRSGYRGRALWTCSDAAVVPASSGQ